MMRLIANIVAALASFAWGFVAILPSVMAFDSPGSEDSESLKLFVFIFFFGPMAVFFWLANRRWKHDDR